MSEMITYMVLVLVCPRESEPKTWSAAASDQQVLFVARTVVCLHSRRDIYTTSPSPPHPQLIAEE